MLKSASLKALLLAAPAAFIMADAAHAADSAANGPQLEEVVVTARRRSENIQSTPVAVTALTSQMLKDKAVANVTELAVATPSLTTTSVFSSTHVNFSMRGRAAENNQFGNSQVVEIYFNEVPQMSAPLAQFYDLESVQVLRGPQGTLFGRASNGGAILFAPTRPGNEMRGYVNAQVGSLNDREFEAAMTMPINDMLSVRVAGNVIKRDGYTHVLNRNNFDLDDKNSQSFRISASFKPVENFSNDFVYDHVNIDQHLGSTIMIAARPGTTASALINPAYPNFNLWLAQNPDFAAIPGVAGGLQSYQATLKALGPRQVYLDQTADELIFQDTVDVASNTTRFNLGGVSVKNILGYQRERRAQGYAADSTPFPILGGYLALDLKPNGLALKRHMVTEELQASGKQFNNRLDWLVGAFYQKLDDEIPGNTLMGAGLPITGAAASYVPNAFHKNSKALFTHLTFNLTESLRASAGFRRTWDYNRGTQSTIFIPLNLAGFQRGPAVCLGTVIPASFDNPACIGPTTVLKSIGDNWILGLDYKVSPDLFTYVSASQGFRPGGINTTATIPALKSFGQETIRQYEAGAKFEHRFDEVATRLNVAAYYQKVTNAQVGYIVFNPARRTTEGVNLNAPKTTVKGIELEGEAIFNRYFRISAFADIIDAKYDEFSIPIYAVDPAAPGGVTVIGQTDVSGNPLPNVPKSHFGATVRVGLPVPDEVGDVGVTVTYFQQSRIVFGADFKNEPEGVGPSYGLLNAQVSWKHIYGHDVDLTAFVKNATDKTYIRGGLALEQQLGLTHATYGEPRTYGISLNYRFGAGN